MDAFRPADLWALCPECGAEFGYNLEDGLIGQTCSCGRDFDGTEDVFNLGSFGPNGEKIYATSGAKPVLVPDVAEEFQTRFVEIMKEVLVGVILERDGHTEKALASYPLNKQNIVRQKARDEARQLAETIVF